MYERNLTSLVDCSFWGMVGIHATSKCLMLWKTGLLNQRGKYTETFSGQLP